MNRALSHKSLRRLCFLGLTLTLLTSSQVVRAFTSISKRTVEMVVVIGGGPIIDEFSIDYTPVRGVSLSDNILIIQGGAGSNPKGIKPAYQTINGPSAQDNETPAFISGPDNSPISVFLQYHFVTPSDDTDPWKEVGGPSTMVNATNASFGFQIDPEEIRLNRNKTLEYKLVAKKIVNGVVVSSVTAPKPSEGLEAYTLNVVAQSPQVMGFQGGRYILPQGNPNVADTTLEVPRGVLKTETSVSLIGQSFDQVPPDLLNGINSLVSIYQVEASPTSAGPFKYTLSYPDFVFPVGQLGKLGSSNVPEQNGIIYGWDGVSWRKLGGKGNATANTITVNSSYYSYLAVGPGSITPVERRTATKLLTPNGDGINDQTDFILTADSRLEIFDSSMHKIRSLYGSQQWDGKDDSGKTVESGAYVYQFKADGELVSGVIGVAK